MAAAGRGRGPGHQTGAHGRSRASALEDVLRRQGVDKAWDAFEEMQRTGLFVDRFAVSRLLMKTVCDSRSQGNAARVRRGLALVEAFIQEHPREADEVLFNAILDTCCRIKDVERLEAAYQKMREQQIAPSHVTLGILVKAYGQSGRMKSVLKVWDDMAEQREAANAVTYGCMIDACVKCGNLQKAEAIFQDMKEGGRHRNTVLYTILIKGYGLEKDLRKALDLFREMPAEEVPYNTITYNSIVDACIKCADTGTAEEIVAEMEEAGSGVQPDLITFSTLLKGYCQSGDLDTALQVAERVREAGLTCDELVYNTLLDGAVKANDFSAGVGLFAEMVEAGMRPSSITHSILLRLYQRNGFRGNSFDAVTELYQHHGLERPSAVQERGSARRTDGRWGLQVRGCGSGDRPPVHGQRWGEALDYGEQGVAPDSDSFVTAAPGPWSASSNTSWRAHAAPPPERLLRVQ